MILNARRRVGGQTIVAIGCRNPKIWPEEPPEFDAEVAGSIPMGRWDHPKEISGLTVYLASEASSFMTGGVIVLDGGKLLW